MKVTIANKKLITKPQTNLEKSKYFKDIEFKTGNFELSTFKKIIENGCTITYLYNDDSFNRSNSYMKNNYLGTQFICVDIDKCDINPIQFTESIKYKPTVVHTTFSNLSEQKQNKYCFHLLYCFDSVIYGEEGFNNVFNKLTGDYVDYVDNCAKDCHRVIFTSNSSLPNYIYKEYGTIYKVKDFVSESDTENYDDLDTFFNVEDGGKNSKNAYISTSTNNIKESNKNFPKEKNTKNNTNAFNLDDNFFTDLNTLNRSDFLNKYLPIYPYINSSIADATQIKETTNGIIYEDWRNYEYYEVPSKYRWNSKTGKHQIEKIKEGNRTKQLMFDCLSFIKCNPNITKEWLVTMLINEVFKFYDNTDKELSNYKITGIAKYGWEMKDNININPIKKKFKILTSYNMGKHAAVGLLNKLMKDDEIGNNIDLLLSVEDNIIEMKKNGLKITKQRLLQFCKEYEIRLLTNKEIRNNKVFQLHKENPTLSSRQLEKLCKENGINITYKTIQTILKIN